MDEPTARTVAGLLHFKYEGSGWKFENLEEFEQMIVGSQEKLDAVRNFVYRTFKQAHSL